MTIPSPQPFVRRRRHSHRCTNRRGPSGRLRDSLQATWTGAVLSASCPCPALGLSARGRACSRCRRSTPTNPPPPLRRERGPLPDGPPAFTGPPGPPALQSDDVPGGPPGAALGGDPGRPLSGTLVFISMLVDPVPDASGEALIRGYSAHPLLQGVHTNLIHYGYALFAPVAYALVGLVRGRGAWLANLAGLLPCWASPPCPGWWWPTTTTSRRRTSPGSAWPGRRGRGGRPPRVPAPAPPGAGSPGARTPAGDGGRLARGCCRRGSPRPGGRRRPGCR